MKRSLLILLLLISFEGFAQTWKELEDSLNYYYQRDEFSKAVPVARKLVAMASKEQGEDNNNYATTLNNLAFLQNKAGDKDGAEENYLQSLLIRRSVLEPDHDDCFSSVQNLGVLYKESGKWKEAFDLYTGYIKDLEKANKQGVKNFAYALYLRGDAYAATGQNGLAEKDLLAVLKLEEKLTADTSMLYYTYSILAGLYDAETEVLKAEKILIRHAELCRLVDGPESNAYLFALYRQAALYSRSGDYKKAEPRISQVTALYKKTEGEDSKNYITSALNHLALLGKTGNIAGADELANALLARKKNLHGEHSQEYDQFVYLLSNSFKQAGMLGHAGKYLENSIALNRRIPDHHTLAARLFALDTIYKLQQRTEERAPLLTEIIQLQERFLLLGDSAYAIRLASLSDVYMKRGDFNNAGALAGKLDSVSVRAFDKTNELYLISRQVIANLYMITEQLDKAEQYYREALDLAPALIGDKPEEYASLLKVTAEMYITVGQVKKAEALLLQAKDKLENSRSTSYPLLASVWYHYFSVLKDLKKLPEAEAAMQRAIDFSGRNPDQFLNHISYCKMLALHYVHKEKFLQADSLFSYVKGLTNKPGSGIYSRYLVTLAQQAGNYLKWGNTAKAAECINEVLAATGKYFRDSTEWDDDLAVFVTEYYRQTGQYKKAIDYGNLVLQQEEKKYGKNSPGLNSTMIILLQLYMQAKEYGKAAELISSLDAIARKNMANGFEILSESEKEKYLGNKVLTLHFFSTLLLRKPDMPAAFIQEGLDQVLLLKSLILSESRKITESFLQSSDTSLQQLYQRWLTVKQTLAKEYARPKGQRRADLEKLNEQEENLQKEMTRKSPALGVRQKAITTTYKDIRENLDNNEVAIEFINFTTVFQKESSVMYAAYITRKGDPAPLFVPLCGQHELQRIFDSAGTSATSMVSKFYRGTELKNKNNAAALGAELYRLVWQPLEPYLKNVKKISYSPAGKLYSIAFHALPVDSSSILMDRYQLQQYSSTRQVALRKTGTEEKVKNIALFGDAAFTLDSTAMVKAKPKTKANSNLYIPEQRGARGGTWSGLPGTADEVKKIRAVFEENKLSTQTFTQATASEENLKTLSGNSPQVLHIATHGFFLPEPDKTKPEPGKGNSYTLANDPLLRSGLILAGGNYAWSGKTPIEGVEDGIATAYEISQLNLSNTELVVLSACETALGDVKGSEGVFGLQRAFKMAGVKKMIVSLWQVPDKETAELMTGFYNYWLKGKTINEAFTQAQADMRKKYSPYHWAAFVLLE